MLVSIVLAAHHLALTVKDKTLESNNIQMLILYFHETYSLVIEYAQLSCISSPLIEFKDDQHSDRRERA